ncbi:hypothetical protein SDJN03_08007, partial [Cucurbita argyrosperma subsp. sororia]
MNPKSASSRVNSTMMLRTGSHADMLSRFIVVSTAGPSASALFNHLIPRPSILHSNFDYDGACSSWQGMGPHLNIHMGWAVFCAQINRTSIWAGPYSVHKLTEHPYGLGRILCTNQQTTCRFVLAMSYVRTLISQQPP